MKNKKQTTVNLTKEAQIIKEDLAPVYGLKNILSAGLILFNKLSHADQKSLIREVSVNEDKAKDTNEVAVRSGRNVVIRTKALLSKKKQSQGRQSKEPA